MIYIVGDNASGSQCRAVGMAAGELRLETTFFAICTAVMCCIAITPMRAQVKLSSVNLGDTNFEDGFAGPELLLEEFPDVYSADTLKDGNGATVPEKHPDRD
jgi:hypothetical protein